MSFDRLGLEPEFLRAVADQGYTEPTPVQAESIPLVLAGRDLMAGAQTGTGKTAAFVLPMLQRLGRAQADPRAGRRPVRALVLAPTRELALQVEESVRVYGRHRAVRSAAIYGGVGFGPQVTTIRRGVDVVVATPGRLLDHLGQGTIELSRVEILVLDEADRMLDMGFIRDIRKVLDVLPSERQNLLFSATFSDEIRSLARGFLRDPATVQVTPRNSAAPLVTQVVHPVDRERKRELLSHLIRTGAIDQALVFTRTKHGANRLAQQLERDGIAAAAIHGNKSQSHRVRALADFKAGRAPILVATEIAARGLDIDGLPHVVNFELPMVPEDYVHRIGRTGRAGSPGHAVSLVCVDEHKLLGDIQRVLGRPIPREAVAGFEPDRSIRPEPIVRGGLGRERPAPRGDRRLGAHARPGVQARPGAQARPGVQARPGAQARPVAQTRPGVQARPGAQARPGVQARPVAQTRPGVQARPGAQARPGVQARPGTQARPGVQARPDGQPMPAAQPRPDMQSRSGAQPLPGAPIGHPASTLRNDSRPHSGRHKRRPDGGRPRPGTSLGAHPGGSRQTGTRPSGSQPAGSGTSGDRSSEGWPSGNRPVVLPGERLAHAERTRS